MCNWVQTLYSMSTEYNLLKNDEPVNKKAFSNGSKSVEDEKKHVFLNHFNWLKRVEMTLLILKHIFKQYLKFA